jgi:hypothetical protein
MIDDGLRDVNQRMAPTYPPVTEIPILRGSKGWIESTAFSKEFGPDGHIVRCEKSQVAVVLEKISVSLIHDDLARRRIRIVGQSVDRPSADKGDRIIAEYPRQFLQPLGFGAQSSSVKARISPRAYCAPKLRAAAGPAFRCRRTLILTPSRSWDARTGTRLPSSTRMISKRSCRWSS